MNQATHIDLSLTVLEALGWSGDRKLAAKNAAFPDQVRLIEVTGLGYNFMGRGFQSLGHFGMPGPKDVEGRFVLNGYCFKRDRSVPYLDLPNRDVVVHPEAWGDPAVKTGMAQKEPTYAITQVLGYKPAADEMTFAAASIMADWAGQVCHRARKLDSALYDTAAGWVFHFVQDLCVPHHVALLLLAGHGAFEGDVDEHWNRLKSDGTIAELLKTLVKVDNAPEGLTIRAIAEQTATKAVVSLRKLRWYRCFWRRGWDKSVHQCVLRGLVASVQVCKVLRKYTSSDSASCRATSSP